MIQVRVAKSLIAELDLEDYEEELMHATITDVFRGRQGARFVSARRAPEDAYYGDSVDQLTHLLAKKVQRKGS